MKLYTLIAFLVLGLTSYAQPYGNEWIEHDQAYYKMKVYEDGIYRISYQTLLQSGIPIQTIDPDEVQLFAKEREQRIYISGAEDGSFDPGDYVEFFGEKNNAWLDSSIYQDATHIPNPNYSVVNDTIYYFLTWASGGSGLRYPEETGTNFSDYGSPAYCLREVREDIVSQYNPGILLSSDNSLPDYVEGEGWMGPRFGKGINTLERNVTLGTTNPYSGSGSPSAIGRTVVATVNNAFVPGGGDNHHLQVFYGPTDNTLIADILAEGYGLYKIDFNIPASSLSELTRVNHKMTDDLEALADQWRIAFVSMKYPHTKDLSDMEILRFEIPSNQSQDKYHVDLTGVELQNAIIYSKDQHRISGILHSDSLDFLLPNSTNGSSEILIIDESAVINVISLAAVEGTGFFTDHAALDLDSAFVIITHSKLKSAALSYAAYRSTGRDAIVLDADDLYDQYGGGIPKHFFAFRRFCDLALDQWESPPAHLFLIGKSIFFDQQSNTFGVRKSVPHYEQCLVPSYGSPGSDLLFTVGLNGNGVRPAIPVGRLSALESFEVLDYLNKVVYNESRDPAAWMKNILHFGGGATDVEQYLFASYLSSYEAVIEDTCFGGYVSTFLKESSLPVEVNLSDSISGIVEEGLSLITFFGHAGGGQFDQSIDAPENLEWGSHPIVIVNSCFSGDIHQLNHVSTSEDYVIIPDKGAVGFIASIKQGTQGFLNPYSRNLYEEIGQNLYGASIGQQMQETIVAVSEELVPSDATRFGLLTNLLQGDPAIKVFSTEKPDLAIDESSISFIPENITAVVDSFIVRVVITNIGKAVNKPFSVELIRTLPDNSITTFTQSLDRLFFRDTINFKLDTDFSNASGINQIQVNVDLPNNVIPEIDNFFNNRATKSLPITDGAVFPVYPTEFAIVSDNSVVLKASTGSPFIEEREYHLQLDTTDTYDSPLFLEFQTSQTGGVIEWDVPLTLNDSVVYYWRVSEWSDIPEDIEWQESSFEYIPDVSGWGQSHFFQFKDDRYSNVVYDRPDREFDFFSGTKSLKCDVLGNSFDAEYFIDFQVQDYNGCGTPPAFHVAVVDPVTLEAWGTHYQDENPDNYFGNLNEDGSCRPRVERYFIFRQNNTAQMESFEDMVLNQVPDGHILLIYTWRFADPDVLAINQPDMDAIFSELGSTQIPGMTERLPFIFMVEKGVPSTAAEIVGDTINSLITLEYLMQATGNTGTITSPLIGPAREWVSLDWTLAEVEPSDSARVRVIGLDASNEHQNVIEFDFPFEQGNVTDLGSLIDAEQAPFLKLQLYLHDPIELDPVQLQDWRLIYQPVPEAALNPILAYSFHSDTVAQGEQLELISAIENISDLDMDSLLVRYWIETNSNETIELNYPRQDSLRTGDVLIDTIRVETNLLKGTNVLWVEANPRNPLDGTYDQLEQYHFNNLGQLKFLVEEDGLNPILDVTFDGTHILDGDIVSARPNILMRLDDENPFLIMNEPTDTAFFNVFLTYPDGHREQVHFMDGTGEEILYFNPATDESNISDIRFQPDLVQDGSYTLLVRASDKSGNRSGDVDYRIGFKIDRKSTITEVLNYPNPFSTSTRFVFTLTGTSVPDEMMIQILTVTGRVVKEIFQSELGPIRIGRNITEYAWDGTDMFGDPLANGVYLYRVVVKNRGVDVEQREGPASTFFKKGFGKMYLMR